MPRSYASSASSGGVSDHGALTGLSDNDHPQYKLATDTREVLTATRTYYVRTDGSDSNDGLTNSSGGAFLTIQKAVNVVAALDTSIYDVTIQVGAGTYTGSTTLKNAVGAGKITIRGDTTTPSNVVISTTNAQCFFGVNVFTSYKIEGFKLQTTTGGQCIIVTGAQCYLELGVMNFGACASHHIQANSRAFIVLTSNYTVSGGAGGHWVCTAGGFIRANVLTITLSGTPAFSLSWAYADQASVIAAIANTYSGSATGKRFTLTGMSLIDTAGALETVFPGDAAGTKQTPVMWV